MTKSEMQKSGKRAQGKKTHGGKLLNSLILSTVCCLLFTASSAFGLTITSDYLEYFREQEQYVATGNVKIEKDEVQIYADKAVLFQSTSDAVISGNTVYKDNDLILVADEAKLNLETKKGQLTNTVIFFKKDNFWISGDSIERIDETRYYAPQGAFTTCDAKPYLTPEMFTLSHLREDIFSARGFESPPSRKVIESEEPDWCFTGKEVNITMGDKLTARDATYRIKGLPVLYTPYLWAPVGKDRQTGFLVPVIGNSSQKGFEFAPAFFWPIDDDKDATLYFDYYSKRGLGTGLEYRQLTKAGLNTWYAYHIRDKEFKKDFYEVDVTQQFAQGNVKGYLDVNYINDSDFYREYGFSPGVRGKKTLIYAGINRFLQSTGEGSLPLQNSRFYLLGQYWVDLNLEDTNVAQRLPEAGYVINPTRIGPVLFTMTSAITNFYRDDGIRGQRLDVFPTVSHSLGDAIQLFQSLSLRETAYNLDDGGSFGSSPHRETFEYRAKAFTRFIKHYQGFTHIVEPSLHYSFIPDAQALPFFDAVDLFNNVSVAQLSLMNTFTSPHLSLLFRLTQPYDFNAEGTAKPLLPLFIQAAVTAPFPLRISLSHDFNEGRVETVNVETGFRLLDRIGISVAESYNRSNNINYITVGADAALSQRLSVGGTVSYDSSGQGLREAALRGIYNEQCWGVNAAFTRKPSDGVRPVEYNFAIMIELKGIGKYRIL